MAKITLMLASGLVLSVGAGRGRPTVYSGVVREAQDGFNEISFDGVDGSESMTEKFYAPVEQKAEKAEVKVFIKNYDGDVSFVKVKKAGKPPRDAVKIESDRMESVAGVEVNMKGHWLITEKKVSAEDMAKDEAAKKAKAQAKKIEAAKAFLSEVEAASAALA